MDQTIWNTLATDIDFGPDGKLYLADWVFGWVGENKGRIYTYFDPARIDSDAVNQVREILRVGLDHESDDRLVELLGHDDRRVRMAAQLELVKQKKILRLYAACTDSDPEINLIRRLHALWGLKQLVMAGADSDLSDPSGKYRSRTGVVEILSNPAQISNAELRAQAVKYGGDVGDPHSAPFAARGLSDESPRVRFMAGLALEKIGTLSELPDVLAMLAENSDTDRYLRHAGIMAVFGILRRLDNDQLLAVVEDLESHESRSVRLAGVVALRRLHSPIVKDFLADSDARVVLEAARAIHDLPIPPALDALAQLIVQPLSDDALVRRVINANMILGHPDNALALARFAADSANAVDRRSDALQLLGRWMSPGPRDYVLGDWRPVTGQRRQDDMAFALETQFQNIVEDGLVAAKAIEVCNSNKLVLPAEAIQPYIIDSRQSDELRIAALKMLRKSNAQQHREVLETLAGSLGELPDELAGEVTDELISIDLPKALGLLQNLVNADDVNARRKQLAVKILGSMNDQASAKLLLESLKLLERGHLNPALWLDVMMAAENRHEDEISRKLNDIRQADAKSSDKLAPYLSTLYGGDAKAGAKIFFEKTEVSCLRCHLVDTRGGTVGPDLSSIGATKDRRYLLESIVEPNKTIAEGFGQLVVLTDEGLTFTGIKKSENDNELLLMDADGKLIRIDKDAIEGTREGLSSMPVDFAKQLTRVEIRDLIEFLVHCDARRSAIHH
jgi:quinoprotein glucose dehydrogenase